MFATKEEAIAALESVKAIERPDADVEGEAINHGDYLEALPSDDFHTVVTATGVLDSFLDAEGDAGAEALTAAGYRTAHVGDPSEPFSYSWHIQAGEHALMIGPFDEDCD